MRTSLVPGAELHKGTSEIVPDVARQTRRSHVGRLDTVLPPVGPIGGFLLRRGKLLGHALVVTWDLTSDATIATVGTQDKNLSYANRRG
jgi:hypothetical protein